MKPKYFEKFDFDTKRMLEEKSNVLKCIVDKVSVLRDIEIFGAEFFNCWKDRSQAFKSVKTAAPILSELSGCLCYKCSVFS